MRTVCSVQDSSSYIQIFYNNLLFYCLHRFSFNYFVQVCGNDSLHFTHTKPIFACMHTGQINIQSLESVIHLHRLSLSVSFALFREFMHKNQNFAWFSSYNVKMAKKIVQWNE